MVKLHQNLNNKPTSILTPLSQFGKKDNGIFWRNNHEQKKRKGSISRFILKLIGSDPHVYV